MSHSRRIAASLVIIALVACAFGFWHAPQDVAGAWLTAYTFWLGASVGALSLLLMLELAGGSWRDALRPALLAASHTLLPTLLLGLPLLFGAHALYPWLRDGRQAGQGWWLNTPVVPGSLALSALFWLWLARRLRADPPMSRALAGVAALLHLLAVSVVSLDLLLALQPAFPSSSFGIETATSQMLTAFCLVLMVTPPLPARYAATASGVLLMLSLLWTYLHFMAYVTIWGADLPDEIAWVLPRTQTSWGWATAIGGLLQGPLAILALAIPAIRRGRALRVLATLVLIGVLISQQSLVGAALHPQGLQLSAWQLAALLAIVGLWMQVFLRHYIAPRLEQQAPAAPAFAAPPSRRAMTATPLKAHEDGHWQAEAQWDVPGHASLWLALGFGAVLCMLLGGIYVYWGVLFADQQHVNEQARAQVPPLPRLQTRAPDDRETVLAAQRRRLESYGWVDQAQGIAHIPIERAMELQAQEPSS
ncbi:MAG TPA: hypothetical protein VIR56_04365 [Solimonas sp.]